MKKILLALVALLGTVAVEAKVIQIKMSNGDPQIYTSTQLSAIDFNDDGTISVYDYNGALIATLNPDFDELTIDDEPVIYEYTAKEMVTDLGGWISGLVESGAMDSGDMDMSQLMPIIEQIPVYRRWVRQLMYYYPSVDPYGDPITLSGCITIPLDIWSGREKSEGILLFNHFTISKNEACPTAGNTFYESYVMCNPVNPNYIMVTPDLYGFGATKRFPQAFVQGDLNGRGTIDGLLAAKRLLEEKGINYGPLTFNAGYSGGGSEALAALKTRDMQYADQVSFDKTFAGGSPADLAGTFSKIVEMGKVGLNLVMPLVMVATNETQHMGLPYNELFQEPLASQIGELILSKKYDTTEIEAVLLGQELKDYVQPEYLDLTTPQSQNMLSVLEPLTMSNGWTPDPSQNIYLFHFKDDDTVPVENSTDLVPLLMANGFTPSTIPGQTNLETNLTITSNITMSHFLGLFPFVIQTVAELVSWPLMYTNGQLNPEYQNIDFSDMTNPAALLNMLEAMGFDVRSMVNQVIAGLVANGQEVTVENVIAGLNAVMAENGISLVDLTTMLNGTGIDFSAMLNTIVEYLINEYYNGDVLKAPAAQLQTPMDQYKQQMNEWLTPVINAFNK